MPDNVQKRRELLERKKALLEQRRQLLMSQQDEVAEGPSVEPTLGGMPQQEGAETALRHAADTGSFGFAPKLQGATMSFLDKIEQAAGPGAVADLINRHQHGLMGHRAAELDQAGAGAYEAAAKEQLQAGEEQHPGAALGGKALGIAATAPILAGGSVPATMARTGAAGTVSGYNRTGDVADALTQGALSAGTAGAVGGLFRGAGRLMAGKPAPSPTTYNTSGSIGQGLPAPVPQTPVAAAGAEWASQYAAPAYGVDAAAAATGGAAVKEAAKKAGWSALKGGATGLIASGGNPAAAAGTAATYGTARLGSELAQPILQGVVKPVGRGLGTAAVPAAAGTGALAAGVEQSDDGSNRAKIQQLLTQTRQAKQRGAMLTGVRKAHVGGEMSPELAEAVKDPIESGDNKRLAATLERLQQNPQLASQIQALMKKGK